MSYPSCPGTAGWEVSDARSSLSPASGARGTVGSVRERTRPRAGPGRVLRDTLGQRCGQGAFMHVKRRREHLLKILSVLTSISSKERAFPRPRRCMFAAAGSKSKKAAKVFLAGCPQKSRGSSKRLPEAVPRGEGARDSSLPSLEPSQPPGIFP